MNETSRICTRCGWDCSSTPIMPTKIDGWPEGLPAPPQLIVDLHPKEGRCPCPFEIGQRLYWDLDGADPDLPPLLVEFRELTQFETGDFQLVNNKWVRVSEAAPCLATVRIVPEGVFECHKTLFGKVLDRDLVVRFKSITPEEQWPIYEVA